MASITSDCLQLRTMLAKQYPKSPRIVAWPGLGHRPALGPFDSPRPRDGQGDRTIEAPFEAAFPRAFHCICLLLPSTALPRTSTAFPLPLLDLSLSFPAFPCLSLTFPLHSFGPSFAFPLPFLNLPITFQRLSLSRSRLNLNFHCPSTALPLTLSQQRHGQR